MDVKKYLKLTVQSEDPAVPSPIAPLAQLLKPTPISPGEALDYNSSQRRAVVKAFSEVPRYPGPSEKKSLAKLIDEMTGGGAELVVFHLDVLRGQVNSPGPEGMGVTYTTVDQREKAAKWLTDRGYGKAVETIKLETEAKERKALSFDHMPLAERTRLLELEEKALAGPAPEVDSAVH